MRSSGSRVDRCRWRGGSAVGEGVRGGGIVVAMLLRRESHRGELL